MRGPRDASWKYIERIGDELMEPYGSMSYLWMCEVKARTKRVRRIRRARNRTPMWAVERSEHKLTATTSHVITLVLFRKRAIFRKVASNTGVVQLTLLIRKNWITVGKG